MTNTEQSISTMTQSEWRKPRPALDGISLMQQLFNRFDGAYPGSFKSKFPDPVSIKNWMDTWEDAFIRDKIHPREVAMGLSRITGEFSPSLPTFLALCRPTLDPESAFREAVAGVYARKQGEMGVWSHPAIYWTSVKVGQHDLLQASWKPSQARWERVLAEIYAQGAWEPIPAPPMALPAPAPMSKTEAQQQIKRLGIDKSILGAKGDPLAWANKVLSNPVGKSLFTVNAARRAINGATA